MEFLQEGKGGWGSKSSLFGSKRTTFGGSCTLQNRSWLRAWKNYFTFGNWGGGGHLDVKVNTWTSLLKLILNTFCLFHEKKKKTTCKWGCFCYFIPNLTPKQVWAQTFKPAVTKTTPFFIKIDICKFPRLKKKTPFSSFFRPLNTKHVLRVVLKETPFYVFYVCAHLYIWVAPLGGKFWCEIWKITFPKKLFIKIGLL